MTPRPALDCLKCPSFCCKLAGYVPVSGYDIARLAKHLGITPREFEQRHVIAKNRRGEKLIKRANRTCQFLGENRACGVYAARPTVCRRYVCWKDEHPVVYDFASLAMMSPAEVRDMESKA